MGWTRGPTIGRGSSAVVSLATGAAGDFFAVKSADLSSSAFLQNEETLISHLCSPYVVKCLGSDITQGNGKHVFNLFLEYIPGGTLSDQIRKRGGALEEKVIRSHARQILLGLRYLHQQGLAHCDIKGQNILIGDGGVKIADFGCAKWVGPGGPDAFSGTPAYMAPEVARGAEQGFAADVWAFGCTVVEMATGSGPWPEMKDPAAALYRIAFSDDLPETPKGLSEAARDMLSRCLTRDPRERWTAAQLLQHPFFDSAEEEEIICRETWEPTRKSPTTVMDKGIWDSLEESEIFECPADIGPDSDSPASRVRALVGDEFPASSIFRGWADGEDWITVRGHEIAECIEIQNSEALFENSENLFQISEDIAGEEGIQIQSSISGEDFVIDYCYIDDSAFFPVRDTEDANECFVSRIVMYGDYVFNGIVSSSRPSILSRIVMYGERMNECLSLAFFFPFLVLNIFLIINFAPAFLEL